ncbi:MAG: lasso RiPP family leader peptide-containing protein [Gemmatimonadota bacterium]
MYQKPSVRRLGSFRELTQQVPPPDFSPDGLPDQVAPPPPGRS